jgi:putative MFS transporter
MKEREQEEMEMDERECEVIESEDVIQDKVTSNHGAVTVDEVIDGMGFGRYQIWLLSLCGAGWAADILDLQVIAYLIPALVKDWQVPRAQLGIAASSTFLGMLLGSLFWGVISDRYGRRPAFMFTSLCAGVFGMAASTSLNVSHLVFWRLLQGFGLGGNLAVDFSLYMEFVPTNMRGSSMVLTVFASLGSMSAAALAYMLLDPLNGTGWRLFLLLAAAPGIAIAALRARMLESPYFLASRGKLKEAEQVLRAVADFNGTPLAAPISLRQPSLAATSETLHVLQKLFSAYQLKRVAGMYAYS